MPPEIEQVEIEQVEIEQVEIEQVRKGGLPPLFVPEHWSSGRAGVNRPSV